MQPPHASLRRHQVAAALASGLVGGWLLINPAVHADVVPDGLHTRVNGRAMGRCSRGVCRVRGGTRAGGNLFLRFRRFNVGDAIRRVVIDTRGQSTVVLGVADPRGIRLAAPVVFTRPADGFWLSPGGLRLAAGSRFPNVNNLVLTSSPSLRLGGRTYQATSDGQRRTASLVKPPAIDLDSLESPDAPVGNLGLAGQEPIVLAGARLRVDGQLLADSGLGPIRSLPVPASEPAAALKAGGSLRLAGGNLRLHDLQAKAGVSGSGGLLRLETVVDPRPGGGDVGRLSLDQTTLAGGALQVRSGAALVIRDLQARITDPEGSGAVQLQTSLDPAVAGRLRVKRAAISGGAIRLEAGRLLRGQGLNLQSQANGDAIRIHSGGTLDLNAVVMNAAGGAGRVLLQTGQPDSWAGGGTLRLRSVQVQGHEVGALAGGDLVATNLQVEAGGAGARGPLTLAAGLDAGRPAPGNLRVGQANLMGQEIQVMAAGRLDLEGVSVRAGDPGLGGSLTLVTGRDANHSTGGPARLVDVDLTAQILQLRAGGGVELRQATLKAGEVGRPGQLQIDTGVSQREGQEQLSGGLLAIGDADLSAQEIVLRGGAGLHLQGVVAQAGEPGARGVIRLESGVESAEGPVGQTLVERSHLEAGLIFSRSSSLALIDQTQVLAPKGWIHLETTGSTSEAAASRPSLRLSASTLDVGVRTWADLTTPRLEQVQQGGVLINLPDPPPSIALFAAGDLLITDQSRLVASQNLTSLKAANPGWKPGDLQVTDVSGFVVLDAKGSIKLSDSVLRADATDNFAGSLLLRSQDDGRRGVAVELRNSTLSASGGAGNGDIRIASDGGLLVAGSRLESITGHVPFVPPDTGGLGFFAGGEINLTNRSVRHPLTIDGAQLRAQQHESDGPLAANSPSRPTQSLFDEFDDPDGAVGGAINLISAAGLQLAGPGTLLSVASRRGDLDPLQGIGGTIRLIDHSDRPVVIGSGVRLDASVGDGAGLTNPQVGRHGEIHVWSQGPVQISGAELSVAGRLLPDPSNPVPPTGGALAVTAGMDLRILGSRLEAMADAVPGIQLRARQEVEIQASEGAVACGSGCVQPGLSAEEHGRLLREEVPGLRPSDLSFLDFDSPQFQDAFLLGKPGFFEPGLPEQVKAFAEGIKRFEVRTPGGGGGEEGRPSLAARLAAQPAAGHSSATAREVPTSRRTLPWDGPPSSAPTPSLSMITPVVGAASVEGLAWAPPTSRAMASREALAILSSSELQAAATLSDQLGLPAPDQAALRPERLQQALRQASTVVSARRPGDADQRTYRPAILRLGVAPLPSANPPPLGVVNQKASNQGEQLVINHLLILPNQEIRGWQTTVPRELLGRSIMALRRQLDQRQALDTRFAGNPLAELLFRPVLSDLKRHGITSLLLSLERDLQSIPFAALPLDGGYLGDHFSIAVTPALGLTQLQELPLPKAPARALFAGSSSFSNGLAPLPRAAHELRQLQGLFPGSALLLDQSFTARSLLAYGSDRGIQRLHLATHADFRASRLEAAEIHTQAGVVSLGELGRGLRRGRQGNHLDLFVLSACRTAQGDEQVELGMAGLALQAAADSAIGALWYVDDGASAAFFVEFYRLLQQGFAKDEALRLTQQEFRRGAIQLRGDRLVNQAGDTLISGLSEAEQARYGEDELRHPYYWSGMVLAGRPW